MNNGLYLLNIAKYMKTYEHKLCAFDSRLHANLPVLDREHLCLTYSLLFHTHSNPFTPPSPCLFFLFSVNFSVQLFRLAKIVTTQQTKICTFQSFCSFKIAKKCWAKQTGFLSRFSSNINHTIFFSIAMSFIRIDIILTKYNFTWIYV